MPTIGSPPQAPMRGCRSSPAKARRRTSTFVRGVRRYVIPLRRPRSAHGGRLLNRIQSGDHERHGSSLSEPGRGGGDLESRGNAIFRDGVLLQIKRFVWWIVRLATAAPRKHGLLTCRSNGRSGISSKSNNRSSLCVQPNPRGPRSIGLHLTKSPAGAGSSSRWAYFSASWRPGSRRIMYFSHA
jgi:hypothetical protein